MTPYQKRRQTLHIRTSIPGRPLRGTAHHVTPDQNGQPYIVLTGAHAPAVIGSILHQGTYGPALELPAESNLMRALTYDGTLQLRGEYPAPVTADDDCLVRVRLAGVSQEDLDIAAGRRFFNGVLGYGFVGVVEQGPTKWKGRRVVCEINCVCRSCDMCLSGLSNHCRRRTVLGLDRRDGCFADLIAVPVRNLHAVPDGLPDEQTVFVEPLAAAFQVLALCPIDRRMKVTVIGATGLAVLVAQVLRTTGCALTVAGENEKQLEFCEKKGIQGLVIRDLVSRQDRDAVILCDGGPDRFALAASLVRPRGTIVLTGGRNSGRPVDRSESDGSDRSISASKSSNRNEPRFNLADSDIIVANELTVVGSRSGPFPKAIDALAGGVVDVRSIPTRVFDFDDAVAAMQHAIANRDVKALLAINKN